MRCLSILSNYAGLFNKLLFIGDLDFMKEFNSTFIYLWSTFIFCGTVDILVSEKNKRSLILVAKLRISFQLEGQTGGRWKLFVFAYGLIEKRWRIKRKNMLEICWFVHWAVSLACYSSTMTGTLMQQSVWIANWTAKCDWFESKRVPIKGTVSKDRVNLFFLFILCSLDCSFEKTPFGRIGPCLSNGVCQNKKKKLMNWKVICHDCFLKQ